MALALVFLGVPILLLVVGYFAVRMSPHRTFGSKRDTRWDRSRADAVIAAAAALAFGLGSHNRLTLFYVALVPLSLAAAAIARANVIRTTDFVRARYADIHAWRDLDLQGSTWRYEMKHSFAHDPEYVDAIVVHALRKHPTYAAFREEVLAPTVADHVRVLDQKSWGILLPPVKDLLHTVVRELFGDPDKTRDESRVYEELRRLAQEPRGHLRLMNRLQYHWTVRNLQNLGQIYSGIRAAEAPFVGGLAGLFLIVDCVTGASLSWHTALRALAAGSLLWVVVICGGTTVLLVNLFRGTGTFTIETPLANKHEDELWPRFTRVGIYAFSASFLLYGIGMPILLTPRLLYHLAIDGRFVVLATLSFVMCALLFAYYIQGIHNLMVGARDHALALAREILDGPGTTDDERADASRRFMDVRELNTWPLNSGVMAEILLGLALPIVVQLILLSAGLA